MRAGVRLPSPSSRWEETFAEQVRVLGLPVPVREYRFAALDGRRWRFDFAWPIHMVAVEIEGGLWLQGRHQRARGFTADAEKYNHATMMGWKVLRLVSTVIQAPRRVYPKTGVYQVQELLRKHGMVP